MPTVVPKEARAEVRQPPLGVSKPELVFDQRSDLLQSGPGGTKMVGGRGVVFVSERDFADDQAIDAETEVLAHELGMRS